MLRVIYLAVLLEEYAPLQGYVGALTRSPWWWPLYIGDDAGPIKMRISWGKGKFSCRHGMNKKLPSYCFISNFIRIPEAEPISISRWVMSCQGSTLKPCAVSLEVDLRLIHCINFLSRDARHVVPTGCLCHKPDDLNGTGIFTYIQHHLA